MKIQVTNATLILLLLLLLLLFLSGVGPTHCGLWDDLFREERWTFSDLVRSCNLEDVWLICVQVLNVYIQFWCVLQFDEIFEVYRDGHSVVCDWGTTVILRWQIADCHRNVGQVVEGHWASWSAWWV